MCTKLGYCENKIMHDKCTVFGALQTTILLSELFTCNLSRLGAEHPGSSQAGWEVCRCPEQPICFALYLLVGQKPLMSSLVLVRVGLGSKWDVPAWQELGTSHWAGLRGGQGPQLYLSALFILLCVFGCYLERRRRYQNRSYFKLILKENQILLSPQVPTVHPSVRGCHSGGAPAAEQPGVGVAWRQ